MKKRYGIILLILFIVNTNLIAEKRALIIAIGDYPAEGGWAKISSTNDVEIIRTALNAQGFQNRNIDVITDKRATKSGIIEAFNSLISKTKSGDIIVFHFSGHGQQVTDISGDELDGLDEALVPYDAPMLNRKNDKTPSKHLLDDDLNIYLQKLREKVGSSGDVLFIIDACHSGTIERSSSEDVYRGSNAVFEIPGYKSDQYKKERSYFQESSERGNNSNLSPFIILSACLANQTNKEYNEAGSLTYALGRALSNDLSNKSYQSLFNSVRTELIPLMITATGRVHNQTPQIEGFIDRRLFAGQTVNIPKHFIVEKIKGSQLVINAGSINGLQKGAELEFYPSDTFDKDKATPIMIGKIDAVELTQSIVSLPSNINRDKIHSSWIFISKYMNVASSRESIEQMRSRILRTLPNNDEISIRMLPITNNQSVDVANITKNGNVYLKYDDEFIIEVSNKTKSDIYFQLINVTPDNSINLLLGNNLHTKSDYFLKAGETKLYDKDIFIIDKGSPIGEEYIVIVASDRVLDLSAIETEKPIAKRSNLSIFEEWINELYSNERSISKPAFDANKVYTNKLRYIVNIK